MADSKQFNPLPLLSVKSGLDSSLQQINTELEQYFSEGWAGSEHLQTAHDELHRAVGVLQMLSLEGLAVFCREFETVLQEMLAQQQAPSNMHKDTLRGALIALTQYLDALADGASNTALRLFYSYQELHQLRGLESAFEVDLFFPEFGVELPAEVLSVPLQNAALDVVKKARTQYQRALLKWLRQENADQSLRTMRATVQTVMSCAPQDQQRAFWWIATGLLDCLIHDGLPAELSANKLLARIDLQMKSMVEKTQRESEYNTTCGMQYMLARSQSVSETVGKIKQTYVLDTYLPAEPPLSHSESAQVLEQMQHVLTEAQEILEHCAKGDTDGSMQYTEKLAELQGLSEKLDKDTLQFLCKQMYNAVADTDNPNALDNIRMELAIGMLLLGDGMDRYQRLNAVYHEQVRILSECLQSGLAHEAADGCNVAKLSALHCQLEEQENLPPLASEMRNNLQQVELSLNVFFSDAAKRSELAPLRSLLNQVQGGLYILGLDVARKLITPVQQAVEKYNKGANPSPGEMHAIASAVSALENYVHGMSQGQKPSDKGLEDVLGTMDADMSQSFSAVVAQEAVIPTGVSVREGGEDAELLEVFLEEAHEVLETLHEHLQKCERNPHSREALIIIRRGFHTLKGSGRMVGLTNLGEVAWAVEKALNKWLQDEKPTSTRVLELIGDAEVLFQHWVDKLRSGGTALIDATALIEAARKIENGVEDIPDAVTETAAVEAEQADIVIGGVSLSPVLFSIATDEASVIIETLQRLASALRKGDHPVVSYDFVRAAHTLAGVSHSTGFTDIAELASTLELWLQDRLDSELALDILQINLLEQTISALSEMIISLRNKQEPKPRSDLITRLQIKKKLVSKPLEKAAPEISLNLEESKPKIETPPAPVHNEELAIESQTATPAADEDIDLVAYVQRVAQEQAGEPLQWKSADEDIERKPEKSERRKARQEDQETLSEPDNSIFNFDMGAIPLSEVPLEQANPEKPAAPPEFAFNFDDLVLTMPGEKPTARAETRSNSEVLPELDLPSDLANTDFLSSVAPADIAPARVETKKSVAPTEIIKDLKPLARQEPVKPQADEAAENDFQGTAGDVKKRAIQDDLDEQLLPIFLEEADELYPQLTSELSSWRANPHDMGEGLKIARKLQRSLHTLKGSARMAGAMRLGELTHRVEDCLDTAVAAGKQDGALLDELENYFDRIGNALEKLRSGDASEEVPVVAAVAVATAAPVARKAEQIQTGHAEEVLDDRRESAVLRVRSDIVDDLVNEAGEISVARSRIEIELNAFKGGLHDLTGSVQGLRKLVREIEIHAEGQMQARTAVAGDSAEKFDPLEFDRFTRFQELTRFMNESVHDVQTVQQALLKNLDETSAAMSAQAKLNTGLQQSLMSIRMLPFSSTSQRLYRIVRQTAKELGKKVNLELYGSEIELDRGVLEKMTAPFEHLMRNAIVHGLESPEKREAKGKPPIGNISLTLRQEGNEVVFEFKDDGAGLDIAKLRRKGLEQGLLKAGEIISDEQVMLLIFETGLSTATELTEISGRGVGMDVVLSEIKALGGRIEVTSEPDKGAHFTIYLPLTLAVMKALMVRVGVDIYALPSVMVEQVQQIKPDQLVEMYRKGEVSWQNRSYPLHYLPRLLGDKDRIPESKPYNPLLLLRSGDQRIALHIDELQGTREVVVKNVGLQLARLPGIAGATVQANGKVVLILNPVPLALQTTQTHKFGERIAVETLKRIPIVMIVDDSLTVRKITTRLLVREGYEVLTAKDGVDALEKLVDIIPDVMLLDVEMPRMDGFELTKELRRDNRTKNLPIIMITSRTADKHRNYAFELGVNGYLGKPYQDDELLENIAKFAPMPESATSH